MSFTERVREELAHVPWGPACCRRAEVAAALRLGAAFHRRGGTEGFGLLLETPSGAVVRRVHAGLRGLADVRLGLATVQAGGLRPSTTYRLAVPADGARLLVALGVVDAGGRPRHDVPPALIGRACDRNAYLRGALLVAGSLSDPRQGAHLEVRTGSPALADDLARLLHAGGARGARRGPHRDAWRVVLKSGGEIADVLAATGAHTAFLAFDQGRLRRELRGAANRAANADRANLARAVTAAARQAAAIEALVARRGWDDLDDDLRGVALARIANPEATLAELGALLEPPLGKSAVHRRLQRLAALADEEACATRPASAGPPPLSDRPRRLGRVDPDRPQRSEGERP